jgi:hypothetical protein
MVRPHPSLPSVAKRLGYLATNVRRNAWRMIAIALDVL